MGDQRSLKTEAYAKLVMAMLKENGDITLAGIHEGLAECGIAVEIGTLWRVFDRHKITRKKSRATQSSRTAPTS